MAIIRPFRAWRYNEAKISDIHRKFSPLFDVVSPSQAAELYKIPNNSIHVSVPVSQDAAIKKWKEWKEGEVVKQDELPTIYVYYQRFSLYGQQKEYVRKGFICMIDIAPKEASDQIVLHEGTITPSVEERTKLLQKTLLNVAPTHGLFQAEDGTLTKLMDSYMENPVYEHIDYQGVINKLAVVRAPEDIAKFQQALLHQPVYLADGHHRLAASRHLLSQIQKHTEVDDCDWRRYHLIYLTPLNTDDLQILPIHRLFQLENSITTEQLLSKIKPYFEVLEITNHKRPIYEELRGKKHHIGMAYHNRHFLLKLNKAIDPVKEIQLSLSPEVKQLDYTLLHYFILEKAFEIPYAAQKKSCQISYEKEYGNALHATLKDKNTIAFFLNGMPMEDMMAVCNTKALMPQKSTYFFPKVVCGLTFASIDPNENENPTSTRFCLSQKA